jgi:isopentenyl-diphosphate Delta-isomerase
MVRSRAAALCMIASMGPVTRVAGFMPSAAVTLARRSLRAHSRAHAPAAAGRGYAEELRKIDAEQAAMMEEQCIIVDRHDKPLRPATKVEAHLCSEGLALHRAFSVFLFDRSGKLLMQQRAGAKHTFPLYWTNSCCSHPLWTPQEMGDGEAPADSSAALAAAVRGAKAAALRKLDQELGVTELTVDQLTFLTRIHYRAADENGVWGEHEVDYIFAAHADVAVQHNPNEIEQVQYMSRADLRSTMAAAERGECKITPWSQHIMGTFLFDWWDKLSSSGDMSALAACADEEIHRVGICAEDETIGMEAAPAAAAR